jgi:diguanylate cyclase (GGDEF)-like protein/PAS domain S-box-containing protein
MNIHAQGFIMTDQNDFYKDIIDNLYDGLYFVDRDRVITYWNRGAERITGYSASETVGRSCRDNLLNHVTANGVQLCLKHCPLAAVMEDGREREAEVFLHHANGHRMPVVVRATAMRDPTGKIIGAIESFSTSMLNSNREVRELRQMAITDPVTGIGNRRHLEGRLSAAIAEFETNASVAGLLFMDVDHFKQFNDLHGHNTGDKVLRMVARTLRHSLRASDTIGRWGGEEFIAILQGLTDEAALRIAAEKVQNLVQYSRLDIAGESHSVTISVGGTLLLEGDTAESFVGRADRLMYESKRAGRNCVTIG